MPVITLPHHFTPRAYQLPFFRAMDGGKKRAVLVDHRRAGKDKSAFNFMVKETFRRVGVYYYFFPTYNQGRKVLWDGIDKEGFKFLDHVPQEVRKGDPNQTEMKLNLINGSIIQVVGSDNIDTIVGTNPVGCVFSEYPLQDPSGWEFVRPILRENGGWAVFPYTPRGKNHGYDLYEMARSNPDWYCERLTINDTYGRGGTVGEEDVESERKAGMSENLIQQEYYCSFDAAVENAVLGEQMMKARSEGRITNVPYDKALSVNTYWDIGRDGAAAWFTQAVRNEIRVIDYFESFQSELAIDFAEVQKKGYFYGTHYFPHDGDSKDYKTGKTPKEIASGLGFSVDIVDKISKQTQINAARMVFNRCWFDAKKCERGINALASWHFGWDEKMRILSPLPVHDWACFHPDTKVLTRYGTYPIMELPYNGEVLTPCGWKRYAGPKITKRNAQLVEVAFKGGYSVKCTPEHLFLTENGWKSAESLTKGTAIQSTLTHSRSISMAVYTVCGRVRNIFLAAGRNFIDVLGKLRLEQFPTDAIYTTKMGTCRTTYSQILSAYPLGNTCQTTGTEPRIKSKKALMRYQRQTQEKKQQLGTVLKKGGYGIAEMLFNLSLGLSGNTKTRLASIAEKLSVCCLEKVDILKSIVLPRAAFLHIESVRKLEERSDVCCIHVEDGGWFSLENGAVVHNSHSGDAFCQMAMKQEDQTEWKPVDRYAKRRRHNYSGWAA